MALTPPSRSPSRSSHRFDFRFAPAYRLAALPLGITPRTTQVRLEGGLLSVRFGPWSLSTPVTNVAGWEETGGFALLKTVGPPHLSFADRGITFATNGDRALCVRLVEPVPGIEPTGRLRHPGVTLTVADPSGLAAALEAARP